MTDFERPEASRSDGDHDHDGPVHRSHSVRWIALSVGVVVILVMGFAFGTRVGREPQPVASPLLGKPAPKFDLVNLDEGEARVRSSDLAGRIYLVNFWASWCVPCRQEAPHLQRFYERWSPRGVEIVGIVWNDRAESARRFRDEFGLTFPQALDESARTALDFGVRGIPETFLVDEQGIIVAKLIGAVGPDTLDELMAAVLGGETYTRETDDYVPAG